MILSLIWISTTRPNLELIVALAQLSCYLIIALKMYKARISYTLKLYESVLIPQSRRPSCPSSCALQEQHTVASSPALVDLLSCDRDSQEKRNDPR